MSDVAKTWNEFKFLVKEMRIAQKRYFSYRDNLVECKKIEKLVDDSIIEIENQQARKCQKTLF